MPDEPGTHPSARTPIRIKICGLTDPAEASACAHAGADWIGLNFHEPSPRFVAEEHASRIIAALPPGHATVGVFVDRPPEAILRLVGRLGLAHVQLHGDETVEAALVLQEADLSIVRAFRLRDRVDLAKMEDWLVAAQAAGLRLAGVLIDAYAPNLAGGTGRLIPEDLLDLLASPASPSGMSMARLILAGGLTPETVAGRVARVRPWMVDVAGGVESAPGRKDPARVADFIAAARSA